MTPEGTFECPVCGEPTPHQHPANADRRWERLSREKAKLMDLLEEAEPFLPKEFTPLRFRVAEALRSRRVPGVSKHGITLGPEKPTNPNRGAEHE